MNYDGQTMVMTSDDETADYEAMDMGEQQLQLQQLQQRQQPMQNISIDGNTRACQSCRASKVRCDQPNPGMPCLRCQKSAKPCIPAGQSWKTQRHMNSRIVEMESKIDKMISAAATQGPGPENKGERSRSMDFAQDPIMNPTIKPALPSVASSSEDSDWNPNGIPLGLEDTLALYIDHFTMETIFNRYLTNMAPTFPVVIYPPGTTVSEARNANPVLFYAILDVASSGFCELEVQRRLRKLIVQTYVHYMLRTDLYNLGLLQALIVSATWYRSIEPLQPGEQMDIYQLSHTAANMALIMGLGESLNAKSWGGPMFPRTQKGNGPQSPHQVESFDARRVWLGCYYLCSNTSMSLHAPNVMRWTRTMDECLEALETSTAAYPSDKVLCQHIRLQHITEEFALQLSLEDSSAPIPTRAIQTQVTHRAFKRQLADWRTNIQDGVWNGVLEFSYYFSWLYISEVAMCTPYSNISPDIDPVSEEQALHGVRNHSPVFSEFSETVDNIFRVFTSLDMSAIRAFPAMHLLRMIYTVIILVKLHFAAVKMGSEEAQRQLDRASVARRLDCIIQMFAGWGTLWPATKLTTAFFKIRTWFEKCEDGQITTQHDGPVFSQWRVNPLPVLELDYSDSSFQPVSSDDGSGFFSSSHIPTSWNGSRASEHMESIPFSFGSPLDIDFPTGLTPTSNSDLFNYPLSLKDLPPLMSSDTTNDPT
ncbi:Zn(II)2Cys6 transcription factor [Aspergillus glaucus CBS 516.65]|uniref:Zn(2)-C6 fungal-type domain-containing protein n=1 Tax=Aspergillus glaucus CBS 516.65 TaxID=1160497 RepID=A0A1L9VFL1_ASPGL|nr:hypothetical protein ASPGLDRAFT_152373 [Aspergillus glaucus CBS 516.65]OJJ82728.1 hypothetical protein ASPGLDRAFT_152373 [Aspergillus glaucus CBS 516.65]